MGLGHEGLAALVCVAMNKQGGGDMLVLCVARGQLLDSTWRPWPAIAWVLHGYGLQQCQMYGMDVSADGGTQLPTSVHACVTPEPGPHMPHVSAM